MTLSTCIAISAALPQTATIGAHRQGYRLADKGNLGKKIMTLIVLFNRISGNFGSSKQFVAVIVVSEKLQITMWDRGVYL